MPHCATQRQRTPRLPAPATPAHLAGAPPHPLALPILGLSALLTLLYFAAFGFGKAHREKEFLVKLFGVGVFLLLAQVRAGGRAGRALCAGAGVCAVQQGAIWRPA